MVATQEKPKTDKVHAEPGRLLVEEHRWGDRRSGIVAHIAEAEATAGARVLDGGEGALRAQADGLVSQHAEIAGCDAAIQEARRRRQGAILAVFAADAQALRRQAESLRGEAGQRQKTIDRLLAELLDFDGAVYIPAPSREAILAAHGVTPPPGATASASKTAALLAEAVRLEAEVDALAARQVMTSGAVEGKDHAEVVDKVLGWDPMQIAPVLSDVEAWLAAKGATAAGQVRAFRPLASGRVGIPAYVLVWKDGLVDAARSKLEIREQRSWQAS